MSDFRGATVGGISKLIAEKVIVPWIPVPEQIKAANILDKANLLRQKRRESLRLFDVLLRSVFFDLFGDPIINSKGWKKERLKNYFKQGNSDTKCGPFGSELKKHEYTNYGIPVGNSH